jgi:hypothetical protein
VFTIQGKTISNIEQGKMNAEGRSKIDEPILKIKGPPILPFIIWNSLFDIRYSFLSWSSSRRFGLSTSAQRVQK